MTDVKPIPDTYPRVTPHSRCGHGAAELDRYSAPEPAPLATYDKLNTWYYSDAAKQHRPRLESARRVGTFDEVVGGLGRVDGAF